MPIANMPVMAALENNWPSERNVRKLEFAAPISATSTISAMMTPASSGMRDRKDLRAPEVSASELLATSEMATSPSPDSRVVSV